MKTFSIVATALALALAAPAMADKGGKHKQKGPHDESAAEHAPGHGKHGKPEFSGDERDVIRGYYNEHPGARELPPGLAKKGKVPPGWQKKIGRGQRIPDDIWIHRV